MLTKLILAFVTVMNFALVGEGAQPHEAVPRITHGNNHAKSGNYHEALAHLNDAISIAPNNARAYKLRGHVYYAMGDYVQALEDLHHVVALVPDSANAYCDRAIVHSILDHHGLALADVERALAIKPDSHFAQAVRKKILERASEK